MFLDHWTFVAIINAQTVVTEVVRTKSPEWRLPMDLNRSWQTILKVVFLITIFCLSHILYWRWVATNTLMT